MDFEEVPLWGHPFVRLFHAHRWSPSWWPAEDFSGWNMELSWVMGVPDGTPKSSVLDWDFRLSTVQLLGYPSFRETPILVEILKVMLVQHTEIPVQGRNWSKGLLQILWRWYEFRTAPTSMKPQRINSENIFCKLYGSKSLRQWTRYEHPYQPSSCSGYPAFDPWPNLSTSDSRDSDLWQRP